MRKLFVKIYNKIYSVKTILSEFCYKFMNINYLETKTKNSHVSNRINAKFNQKYSHLSNDLYKLLKENNQNNQKAEDEKFQRQLLRKIESEPQIVISDGFSRNNETIMYQKRRKSLIERNYEPRKSYQLTTKSFANRKLKRTRSGLLKERTYTNQIKPLPRANTLFHRTITEESQGKRRHFVKKNSLFSIFSSKSRSIGRSFEQVCKQIKPQIQQPVDFYYEEMNQFIEQTKRFESSLMKNKRKYQIIKSVNQKAQEHFGLLIMDPRDFPDLEFDNLHKLTKAERYKFSSNNILENVLLKNDSEVQQWINNEKNRLLRRRSTEIVRDSAKINSTSQQHLRQIHNMNKIIKERQKQLKAQPQKIRQQKPAILQNLKRIKQYEKKKYVSKSIFPPKRSKNLIKIK